MLADKAGEESVDIFLKSKVEYFCYSWKSFIENKGDVCVDEIKNFFFFVRRWHVGYGY